MQKIGSLLFLVSFAFSFSESIAQTVAKPYPISPSVQSKSYVFLGGTNDTITAAISKGFYLFSTVPAKTLQLFARVTNVSGTSNVKVVLQESYDNLYWKGLDSVTVSSTVPLKFGTVVTSYAPYNRIYRVPTGTQVTKEKYFITVKIQ